MPPKAGWGAGTKRCVLAGMNEWHLPLRGLPSPSTPSPRPPVPPRLAACTLPHSPLPAHGSLPWPLASAALGLHAPHSITMIVLNHTQDHVAFLHKSSPASPWLSRQAPPSFPLSPLLPCGSSSPGWLDLPRAFSPLRV